MVSRFRVIAVLGSWRLNDLIESGQGEEMSWSLSWEVGADLVGTPLPRYRLIRFEVMIFLFAEGEQNNLDLATSIIVPSI